MTLERFLLLVSVILATPVALSSQPSDNPPRPLALEWRRLPDLPDPVGLKGMYGGVSAGQVVLAGGSNFPVSRSAGGRKTFHRAIYVRPVAGQMNDRWQRVVEELPQGLGEGASVTTESGIVALGGHDGNGPVAAVFLLRWDAAERAITRVMLPELPEAVTNAAAAWVDGWIYVAGGEGSEGAVGKFWRLNLSRALATPETRWESLPAWPGAPRHGSILVPVTSPGGASLLFGGGIQGPARSAADYLRDAYLYEIAALKWSAAAALPRGAVLAAALAVDASRVLVLGGSDGHDFERMEELGERYRIPDGILLYDARSDRWSAAGSMPLGVVGAAVVKAGDGWLLAGGEYSPGLRTPQVFALQVRNGGEVAR